MGKISRLVGFIAIALLFAGQGCFSLNSGDAEGPKTTGPAGVFASVNKGESWKSISLLPTVEGVKKMDTVGAYRIFGDPSDSSALYLASRESGLFYSYDEGRSWQRARSPLDTGFIYGVAVHPTDKCEIFATNGRQLFKTEDCGRAWLEIYREDRADAKITSIDIERFEPYEIFMVKASGEILRSSDHGDNWSLMQDVKGDLVSVIASPSQKGLVYVASKDKGMYRSLDSGQNWESIRDSFKNYTNSLKFRRLEVHPTRPNVVYWISSYGILYSEDRGDSWQAFDLITVPGSVDIYGFAVNAKNDKEMYYIATINNRSSFYYSKDGGVSWEVKKLPSGQIPTALRLHPEKTDVIYLGFTIPPKK